MSDILSYIAPEAKPTEENCMVLCDPDPEAAAQLINKYRSRYVIVLYGNLCAYYEGRAKANLDLAPRLLILKPDGTLLIHESTKREPVIWQPPKATFYAMLESGVLVIKSVRHNPYEVVKIEIPSIYFMGLFKVAVTENYKVYGTEKDLVNFLVRNPSLIEPDIEILEIEHKTPVGDIDVLARDREGNIVVIEVKRGQAGPEAVHQLKRYVEYIQQKYPDKKVRGILIAQDITSSAYRYLREYNFKFVRITQKVLEKIQQVLR